MAEIPGTFAHMLAAWNETDTKKIRGHLDKALSKDVEFVDPNYAIEGVSAFARMVKEFRQKYPDAKCVRTSGIDMHHDRARYSWSVIIDAKTRIDGFDAVQVSKKSGKIKRVDGFFGPLPAA
ncbi:MAG: nuclear transport factor 2 family protein [Parvularculaceae bacterium]